jgi:hypothetical protein
MPLKVLPDDPPAPPVEVRGVQNPRIVDLVTRDPRRGEVVLKILEGRSWAGDPKGLRTQLEQLEDKLNAYYGYVLDGFLVRDYPQYEDTPVCIRLECPEEPAGLAREMLDAAQLFSARHDIRFETHVVDDPLGDPVPWEPEA